MAETATDTKAWTRGPDAAEESIDTLIERRATLEGNPDWHAEQWEESIRAYTQAAEEQRREQWLRHHARMERLHASLAEEHRRKAEKLGGAVRDFGWSG